MATQRLTQDQLENVLWKATVMALGLDPKRDDVQKRVRISWPKSETGSTTWRRDENVTFLRITPGYDDYGTLHDSEYVSDPDTGLVKEVVTYHRTHSISWVCYGPDADNDADAIRIGIIRPAVRAMMAKQHLAMMAHIIEPVRINEPDEAGQWWERCDLTAQCYEYVRREYDAEEILVAPNTIPIMK